MKSLFLDDEELELHRDLVSEIRGPIAVLGAGGFVGANLTAVLQAFRDDVQPVVRRVGNWRSVAAGIHGEMCQDLSDPKSIKRILDGIQPATVFNLVAFGSYPHQIDFAKMVNTNLLITREIAQWCHLNNATLVHTGSSSEYGANSAGSNEESPPSGNSYYSITKFAGSQILSFMGSSGLRGFNLRLYSVYGPLEEPSRLFPTLIREGLEMRLPRFSSPEVSRDFVYITDVLEACWRSARQGQHDGSFRTVNIGTGRPTTLYEIADLVRKHFGISESPQFGPDLRPWDLTAWFADNSRARAELEWIPKVDVKSGLERMTSWYQKDTRRSLLSSPTDSYPWEAAEQKTISAVIACYRDEQAIPIMYERLKRSIQSVGCRYEIIFVNDASPDNSRQVIKKLSLVDPCVIGINHTRNFGSQAAFLSGLGRTTGDLCVLLDGDLQDPPEVITEMFAKIEEGADIAYGERTTRTASKLMNFAYKMFYRLLRKLSPFPIPLDAGDFALMSREVVDEVLSFKERDLFLRSQRAYLGRKQVPVSYHRPERPFGSSTNNLKKNIRWAIRGIVSASSRPLSILGSVGVTLFLVSLVGIVAQIAVRIAAPEISPPGIVSLVLLVAFFGSLNILAVSIVGEYVGRILDEVRGRPRFIQESLIRNGVEIRTENRKG